MRGQVKREPHIKMCAIWTRAADRAAAVGLCAVAHHAVGQRPPVAAAAAVPRHGQRPEPQAAERGGRGAEAAMFSGAMLGNPSFVLSRR